jgi:hypothetical protein
MLGLRYAEPMARAKIASDAYQREPERELRLAETWLRERLVAMRDDYRRKRATVDGAVLCEDVLELVDQYFARCEQVVVTLEEAGEISGYHPEHLSRLVREGKIPDLRPAGSRGRIRIALTDLPTKPGHKRPERGRIAEIAAKLQGKRN